MVDSLDLALVLLIGIAAARVTALIVLDDITEPIRHWIFTHSPPPTHHELGPLYQEAKPGAGWFGSLLSCYHCAGVWVSTLIYLWAHYSFDTALPVLLVAAIAQVSDLAIKHSRG